MSPLVLPFFLSFCCLVYSGVVSAQRAPQTGAESRASEISPVFRSPSLFYSWYSRTAADAPWELRSQNTMCSRSTVQLDGAERYHAVRIVTLSGRELTLSCDEFADVAAEERALAQLEADELAAAAASRAELEADAVLFTSYRMLQSLLKHAPDSLTDEAWTLMTLDEIKLAQAHSNFAEKPGFDWVFPVADLQNRNPQTAAEELMPAFRQEVLRRAASVPDTFIMQSIVGNLKYERAAGVLQFADASGPDQPARYKRALNFKYRGVDVYNVTSNDGLLRYDEAQVETAGLRLIAGPGRLPGLIPDRAFTVRAFSMLQPAAERLLNKTDMLLVNTVLTITGAEAPQPNGLAVSATSAFLGARIDRVFVTDPAGNVLATYDVSQMPLQVSPESQTSAPASTQSPQAAAFCRSFDSRHATAVRTHNARLIENLLASHEKFNCGD